MIVPVLYLTLLTACCLLSLLWGGRTERAAATIMAIGSLLTPILTGGHPNAIFAEINITLLLIDTATLMALIAVARLSARFWPIWIAALQFLSVMANLAAAVRPTSKLIAYAFDEELWSWPILVIIGIAAVARRRTKRLGDRSPISSGPWVLPTPMTSRWN